MSMNTTDISNVLTDTTSENIYGARYGRTARSFLVAGIVGATALTTTVGHSFFYIGGDQYPPTLTQKKFWSDRNYLNITTDDYFSFLREYRFELNDKFHIISYLSCFGYAQKLLEHFPKILDSIYGNVEGKLSLKFSRDPETEERLLNVVFDSGLPVDRNFIDKERMIFKRIIDEGMEEGLANVIFINS